MSFVTYKLIFHIGKCLTVPYWELCKSVNVFPNRKMTNLTLMMPKFQTSAVKNAYKYLLKMLKNISFKLVSFRSFQPPDDIRLCLLSTSLVLQTHQMCCTAKCLDDLSSLLDEGGWRGGKWRTLELLAHHLYVLVASAHPSKRCHSSVSQSLPLMNFLHQLDVFASFLPRLTRPLAAYTHHGGLNLSLNGFWQRQPLD